jgi:hypothetical protein
MGRRQFMNLLTFGSVTGVALGALYPQWTETDFRTGDAPWWA